MTSDTVTRQGLRALPKEMCIRDRSSNSTSQSATQQSGTAAQETSRVGESGSAAVDGTSEDGGIIDGVVNDIEKGADDVRNGMDNMESTSAGDNANTSSNGANE